MTFASPLAHTRVSLPRQEGLHMAMRKPHKIRRHLISIALIVSLAVVLILMSTLAVHG